MSVFQWVFIPFCLLATLWFVLRTLRGSVPRRQGLFWILLWSGAAWLIAVPGGASVAASWLGIGRGADLVFYLAILAGLLACVYFYNRYRRLEILVTGLVRQRAAEQARRGDVERPADEVGAAHDVTAT